MSQILHDDDVITIARALDQRGFAVVDNFVAQDAIDQARATIEAAVHANGNESVGRVKSLDQFEDTFVFAMARDPDFIALCRRIYTAAFHRPAPDSGLVPSLRCLSGKSGAAQSMFFHYDSYVLAAIVPIIIPTGSSRGRLVVYPNTRRIRRTYLANLLDKMWTDSSFSQRRYRSMYDRASDRLHFLDMEPGGLYLFWGYRSIHTNEACPPEAIRSTAIFHYYDPHAESTMKRLARLRYEIRPTLARLSGREVA